MVIRSAVADELACVLIPQGDWNLLLPNETVAEIVRVAEITPRLEVPDWLEGHLSWRGLSIPLVNVLKLSGMWKQQSLLSNFVVLNRSRPLAGLPFFAIRSSGAPRLVRVAEEDLVMDEGERNPALPLLTAQLGEDAVLIPFMERFEEALVPFLTH